MNITVLPLPDGEARRSREEEGTQREPSFLRHVNESLQDCKSFFFERTKAKKYSNVFPSQGRSLKERQRCRRHTITGLLQKVSRVQGYKPETKQGHHGNCGKLQACREFLHKLPSMVRAVNVLSLQ